MDKPKYVLLEPDLHKKAKILAADRDKKLNKFINEILRRALSKMELPEAA